MAVHVGGALPRPAPGRPALTPRVTRRTRRSGVFHLGRSRRSAIAVLIFMAALPLQWQVLAVTPLGIVRWFHIAAVVMFLIALPGGARLQHVVGQMKLSLAAATLLTASGIVTAVAYDGQWTPLAQQAVYILVGISFAAVIWTAQESSAGRRTLVWTAPVTAAVFVIVFTRTLQANGVNYVAAFRRAFTGGDPNALIFGLFRAGFVDLTTAQGRANTRHEIVAALLVAVFVTCMAGKVRLPVKLVSGVGVSAILAFSLIALSRSIMLALLVTVLAVGARFLLRGRLSLTQITSLAGLIVVLVIAVPLTGNLLASRIFGESASYDERIDAFYYPSSELLGRVFGGGPDLLSSTHTLIGDTLLRSGWLGCLGAMIVVFFTLRRSGMAFQQYCQTTGLYPLVAFSCGALFVVRAFTSGQGYLHQVEWVAFGILVVLTTVGRGTLSAGSSSEVDRRHGVY